MITLLELLGGQCEARASGSSNGGGCDEQHQQTPAPAADHPRHLRPACVSRSFLLLDMTLPPCLSLFDLTLQVCAWHVADPQSYGRLTKSARNALADGVSVR
jgi:hypothetical protein